MKINRFRKHGFAVASFTVGKASYGRNACGNYRIEFELPLSDGERVFKLYDGPKRPIIRHLPLINSVGLVLFYLVLPFVFLFGLVGIYFNGARNFYKDNAWQQDVREFNWMNVVLVIVLTIWLIIKY